MSPLSNLVYLCIIPSYVLTTPHHQGFNRATSQHLYVSLDISVLIARFGDQAHAYRVDTPTSHQKWIRCLSTNVSWLFDKLYDNNASDDGLYSYASVAVNKQISEVILTLGNDAILVVYQINVHCNTYAGNIRILPYQLGPVHCKINNNQRFYESCITSLYLMGSFLIGYMEVKHSLRYVLFHKLIM